MCHPRRALLVSVIIALIALSACSPASLPPPTDMPLTATDVPIPSPTATLEPSSTSSPTPVPTSLPTPTAPADWFTPGHALEEKDYFYYDRLLLNTDDNTQIALVTGGGGVSMTPCETCDLVALRYVYATYTPKNTEVTFAVILYRHTSLPAAQAALQQHINESLSLGNIPGEIPADLQLPPETVALSQGNAVAIMTLYGAFEIQLLQAQQNDLPLDESIEFFAELAELQIAKLKDAGY